MEKNKPKKGVLITIIVLLIIFIPLTVFSFVLHAMQKDEPKNLVDKNTNHDFLFQGSLYFYNQEDKLIGTYTCSNPNGICDYATSSLNDTEYDLDPYVSVENKISLIKNQYAFLIDADKETNAKPFLYDVINQRVVTKYKSVKNYGVGFEEPYFIVENESSKFGILSLKETPAIKVKFEYDFIGVGAFLNSETNLLSNDFFMTKKDEFWYLIDQNGAVLTDGIPKPIVSYTGKNLILKDLNGYELVDYKNVSQLENGPFQVLSFTGKFVNILSKENQFYVYDLGSQTSITSPIEVKSTDKISSRINDLGKLEVVLNEKIMETVAIS